jgi:predicted metal-binding membrane protein
MSDAAVETVFRRDRAVVLAALVCVAALAWIYILQFAAMMHLGATPGEPSGMDTGGMNMAEMVQPAVRAWSVADFVLMFSMWAVMMVGMMLPSAAPMVLIYTRVARHAQARSKPFAPTAWFVSGYLLVWAAFALFATVAQWTLERALLLTPTMASASSIFGGAVLIVAGLYQWTPLKENCLSNCQSPLVFIQRHGGFRREPSQSLKLGAEHGFYCLGCCWALMGLLFVGGVMNLLWIAGIAALVLVEKTIQPGRWLPRASGAVLVCAGAWLLVGGL